MTIWVVKERGGEEIAVVCDTLVTAQRWQEREAAKTVKRYQQYAKLERAKRKRWQEVFEREGWVKAQGVPGGAPALWENQRVKAEDWPIEECRILTAADIDNPLLAQEKSEK